MVDETPRFGLNTYEPGDTEWDHTDAVEAIDALAIESGPIEQRPETGSYDDELYAATDQRIVWRWNDAEGDWRPFGGLGTSDHPVPGVTHFESVRTGSLNATAHVSTEDDLNEAIRELPESGGEIVLSAGTHVVDPITSTANDVTIRGASRRATTVEPRGDHPVFELTDDDDRTQRRWTLEKVRLAAGGRSAPVIRADRCHQLHLTECTIDGTDHPGNLIEVRICWDWRFNRVNFRRCGDRDERTAAIAIERTEADSSNNWEFANVRFEPIHGHAITADKTVGAPEHGRFRFVGCKFHGDPEDAPPVPQITGGINVQLVNCLHSHCSNGVIHNHSRRTLFVGSRVVHATSTVETMLRLGGDRSIVANSFIKAGGETAIHTNSNRSIVAGNVVQDGSIVVDGTESAVTGNSVWGGWIETRARGCTVAGNTVRYSPTHGIIVVDADLNTITGNSIHAPDEDGIHLEDLWHGAVVTSNTIRSAENGIVSRESDRVIAGMNLMAAIDGANVALSGEENKVVGNLGGE